MRTSLTEIKQIEDHLAGTSDVPERLVFEAKMLTQPELRINVHLQQTIIRIVNLLHRKKMKQDLQKIHDELFSSKEKSSFRKNIFKLFNPK
jgi:hypothetical protein